MIAPGDDVTAKRIRYEARPVWRRVSSKDKESWEFLNRGRNTDPKIWKKGVRLLKSQGLLAELKVNCQYILNATDAKPSPSAPAHSEPAKASVTASRNAPSPEHAPDQPFCPPVPAVLEHASAAHPRRKDVADPQDSPDRSYSPPECILSQHTLSKSKSPAHTRRKDAAGAQSSSRQSNPSPELIRPERTSLKRPKSREDAKPRGSSDQSSSSSPETIPSQHTPAQYPRAKDYASSPSTSDQSPSSSPEPALRECTSASHPRSEDDDSAESTSDQSSSGEEEEEETPTSAVGSRYKDDTSPEGTPGRSSSPPKSTVFGHMPVTHPTHMAKPKTKSNSTCIALLRFRADHSETNRIEVVFPCLSRASSTTPGRKACYVAFVPRPEQSPGCLFVVNTPDVRTKRRLSGDDLELACSAPGLSQLQRRNKNLLTVSLPNQTAAASALRSLSIPLPSMTGQSLDVKAGYHGPYPARTFSCDATDLAINHTTVGARVLKALRGRVATIRAPFEVLRQQSSDPKDDRRRYLLRFDFGGNRPPCTPWVQCFYIPLDGKGTSGNPKVWGVFLPDDVLRACPFCRKQCQRGGSNVCPFTKIIGKR
jgi:hypothetical protein